MALKVYPTAHQARSFVEKGGLPNVEADSFPYEGGYLPLAHLRSDQLWAKDRLQERGIMVLEKIK